MLTRLWQTFQRTRLGRSIFRVGLPQSNLERAQVAISSFFLHFQPAKVNRRALKFRTTLGLGLISLYLFLILVATGVLLMFYYVPSTDYAYQNMKDLEFVVTAGLVLRNMHRWAAHLMVLAVVLHLCRVFYTAAYKPPREFNWGVGVILLVLTLLLSFTGYLLPWDQLAIWAITVGSNMARAHPFVGHEGPGSALLKVGDVALIHSGSDARFLLLGGRAVGGETLLRFYVLHCVALPLVVAVLIAVHFWRVRKDGGISGAL